MFIPEKLIGLGDMKKMRMLIAVLITVFATQGIAMAVFDTLSAHKIQAHTQTVTGDFAGSPPVPYEQATSVALQVSADVEELSDYVAVGMVAPGRVSGAVLLTPLFSVLQSLSLSPAPPPPRS